MKVLPIIVGALLVAPFACGAEYAAENADFTGPAREAPAPTTHEEAKRLAADLDPALLKSVLAAGAAARYTEVIAAVDADALERVLPAAVEQYNKTVAGLDMDAIAAQAQAMPLEVREALQASMERERALRREAALGLEVAALRAAASGLSIEDERMKVRESFAAVDARLAAGETPLDIAYSSGWSREEFVAKMAGTEDAVEAVMAAGDGDNPGPGFDDFLCVIRIGIAASELRTCEADAEASYQACISAAYMGEPGCYTGTGDCDPVSILSNCSSNRSHALAMCMLKFNHSISGCETPPFLNKNN